MAKRYMYSMSHQVATLGEIGALTPTCIQEVAPGDTWSGKVGILLRMSPMERAMLMDLYVDQYFFYVPHRLVYADWENFIAQGPMDTPDYTLPTQEVVETTASYESIFWASRQLAGGSIFYNALRLYAINLVWNEFFRDEQDAIRGPADNPGQRGIAINAKKDYWTTLRDDLGLNQADQFVDTTAGSGTQVSATEILRAIAQQKIAMKRATYGTRYIDILRSYGINVNYQMLQRPEVVAIARGSVNVTDVVATGDSAPNELGAMAGHGIHGGRLSIRRKTFPEHGTLLGFVCVRPVYTDSAFIDWFDSNRGYTDYYDPGLVPLPPVEVTGQDIRPSSVDDSQFGFQQWGNWYRSALSKVHRELDTAAGTGWIVGQQAGGSVSASSDLRNLVPINYDTLFTDKTFGHYQVSVVNHLRALRSIPRTNMAIVTGMPG